MSRARVGIVNDLRLALEVLRGIVASDPKLEVCWTAADGVEACQRCAEDLPDIVLMDLVMPVMNGAQATREIMAKTPCPVLVVTATVQGNMELVYEAMGYGALDAVVTPTVGGQNSQREASTLLRKIDTLLALARSQRSVPAPVLAATNASTRRGEEVPALVAIGASTGGPAAVEAILRELPVDFPAAVVVIQHIDHDFVDGLVTWLAGRTKLPVALAQRGDRLQPARVLVSDSSQHLSLLPDGWLTYVDGPSGALYVPSVDVFFESVAQNALPNSSGVLLTGLGRDGAAGLLAMKRAGLQTVAQDRATSVVYGMPGAAAELDAARQILPINEIAPYLIKQHYLRGRA